LYLQRTNSCQAKSAVANRSHGAAILFAGQLK
jgi:hypothetical protein